MDNGADCGEFGDAVEVIERSAQRSGNDGDALSRVAQFLLKPLAGLSQILSEMR